MGAASEAINWPELGVKNEIVFALSHLCLAKS
jgi:hypothetical protein